MLQVAAVHLLEETRMEQSPIVAREPLADCLLPELAKELHPTRVVPSLA